MATRPEHRGIATGLATVAMSGGIFLTTVSLHFDNATHAAIVAHQELVQQLWRHDAWVAVVEGAGEGWKTHKP